MSLVVQSGPRDLHGRWKCEYVIGFRYVFYIHVYARLVLRRREIEYGFAVVMLGGQHVATT